MARTFTILLTPGLSNSFNETLDSLPADQQSRVAKAYDAFQALFVTQAGEPEIQRTQDPIELSPSDAAVEMTLMIESVLGCHFFVDFAERMVFLKGLRIINVPAN